MIRTHTILIALLAAGAASVALAPANAEFFGCNTPKVSHYTVSSGSSYRAGSRHYAYGNYTPAPRHYYGRTSHYSDYSARNYRSHY